MTYSKLRKLIQESDLTQCSLLINKIKEFRHTKTKLRQMDKFNRLWNKVSRYMYNNSSFGTFGRIKFFSAHVFQQTLK